MNKVISLFKDDVYRPKIEKEFKSDDFFYGVYDRAFMILKEIEERLQDCSGKKEVQGCFVLDMQQVSNNIIAFCGERGQGKSSAMQSFAEILKQTDEKSPFAGRINCTDYSVLKLIDPSSLENGESLIRVLLSKMFYQFLEWDEKNQNRDDTIEFRRENNEILELFQECYMNIDYIKNQSRDKAGRDDLESLAGRGNSAELRRNLYKLINWYLKRSVKRGAEGPQYLIIQIDDADLATQKIFEICEDIRNYLELPNVIILMAMDYEQMIYAIYQRYLCNFKSLHDLQTEIRIDEKCYEMATRYLEKILPAGHRIMLPDINTEISENKETIKFRYIVDENDLAEKKLSERIENCSNIQEQLLKLIYIRTGVIFLVSKGEFHPFLPHTLRELTHFLQLLYSMNDVDCDEVYLSKKGVNELRENLFRLKLYYMDYWCPKNLKASQVELIKNINKAGQNRNNRSVSKYIRLYLKDSKKGQELKGAGYQEMLHMVTEGGLTEETELQEAIKIYYTIFLNEWLANAIERPEEYIKIVTFLDMPVYLSQDAKDDKKGYEITDFDYILENFKKRIEGGDPNSAAVALLDTFCIVRNEDTGKVDYMESVVTDDHGQTSWNQDITQMNFNMLNLIFKLLLKPGEFLTMLDEKIVFGSSLLEVGQAVSKRQKADIWRENVQAYLIQARNIIANVDVQYYLQETIERQYRSIHRKAGKKNWKSCFMDVYNKIDSWVEEVGYLEIDSILREICADRISNKEALACLFLSNSHNAEQFQRDYVKSVEGYAKRIGSKIIELRAMLLESEKSADKIKEFYLSEKQAANTPIHLPEIGIELENVSLPKDLQDLYGRYNEISGLYKELIKELPVKYTGRRLSVDLNTDKISKTLDRIEVISQKIESGLELDSGSGEN